MVDQKTHWRYVQVIMKPMEPTEKLLERIEFLRNKMAEIALVKGFTSYESITISQELDKLLNLYDQVKYGKRSKKKTRKE